MEMTVRNWILLGILICLLILGIVIKLRTRKLLQELDGLGEITVQDGTGRKEPQIKKEVSSRPPEQQEKQYDQTE